MQMAPYRNLWLLRLAEIEAKGGRSNPGIGNLNRPRGVESHHQNRSVALFRDDSCESPPDGGCRTQFNRNIFINFLVSRMTSLIHQLSAPGPASILSIQLGKNRDVPLSSSTGTGPLHRLDSNSFILCSSGRRQSCLTEHKKGGRARALHQFTSSLIQRCPPFSIDGHIAIIATTWMKSDDSEYPE